MPFILPTTDIHLRLVLRSASTLAQACLLGSHRLVMQPSLQAVWQWWSRPVCIARPQLQRGDVLVYSSALLHRGEANRSDASRPVVVYRYDRANSPVAGVRVLGTQLRAMGTWCRMYGT